MSYAQEVLRKREEIAPADLDFTELDRSEKINGTASRLARQLSSPLI